MGGGCGLCADSAAKRRAAGCGRWRRHNRLGQYRRTGGVGVPIGAAIGGAVIGAGGSIIAGSQAAHAQRSAANTAADTSLQVANENNALIRETRGQNLAIASPFY